MMMIASAGTAPKPRINRHSQWVCSAGNAAYSASTSIYEILMAAYQVGHHMAMLDALLPRPFNRENSAKKAMATGKSMPTPSPMTNRAPPNVQALGAIAQANAAMTKKNISAINTR